MKSVLYVMVLLLLLFQGTFSMFSFKQQVKHVLSRLSAAMKTGSTAALSDMGLKNCKGRYTIIVSLADDDTTVVESILKDLKTSSSSDVGRCKVIEGDLTIRARTDQDARLAASDYPPLIDILVSVQKVTGDVKIIGTPDLSSIVESLSKLKTIGKSLSITHNRNLGSLRSLDEAFPGLSNIGEYLDISYNTNLGSMNEAFPSLSSKINYLTISNNKQLYSMLNAFPMLSKIKMKLDIAQNPNLSSMEGSFPRLEPLLGIDDERFYSIRIAFNGLDVFDNVFNNIRKGKLQFIQGDINVKSSLNRVARDRIKQALDVKDEFTDNPIKNPVDISNATL